MHGLLLFAHGARDPQWARPFEAVALRAAALSPASQVMLAYLDFMTPSLAAAAEELVARGCDSIDVVPLFLGAGGHVRQDIPLALERLHGDHPSVQFQLRIAIGEAPSVIEAMAREAVGAPGAERAR